MTANQLITNLASTTLVGIKLGDTSVPANVTTLLQLLNMAKDKIAEDTLLWLGGESLNMVTDTYEYTLSTIPIQVTDVFDENDNVRPRNNQDALGYFQTSPNKLQFNSITNGMVVKVNYYYYPPDYLIDDTLVLPNTLLSAMQYYIAHKAFEIYKSENDVFYSAEYMKKYIGAIKDYTSNSDSLDVDTAMNGSSKLWLRGIK